MLSIMKTLLLSNDDGITALGIKVLARQLAKSFKVVVVAPDRQRSASGHALTLHKPLRFEKTDIIQPDIESWFTSGTPCDCIKFGVTQILGSAPDLIISGINSGANLGGEIFYSGTVAAAREGALLQIPSIAISLFSHNDFAKHYDSAAIFLDGFIKTMFSINLENVFKKTNLLNINVPDLSLDKIKEVVITEPGIRLYNDQFEKRIDPRGKEYFWLNGQTLNIAEAKNSDIYALEQNKISISPISLNLSCHESVENLKHYPQILNLNFNTHEN